jgi:parallel beta-helix repeat protein
MKRLACVILMVTILGSCLAFVNNAHATIVNGIITTDTEWTTTESPIIFNGSVIVSNNVTLTIDAGVTVNLGVNSLQVEGTLIAVGDSNNKILFTVMENISQYITDPIFFSSTSPGWSQDTNTGSIIQNAILNKISVQINNASPKIDDCYFNFTSSQSPISISGGSPIISKNDFVYNGQDSSHYVNSINVYMGTPVISNNEFDGNGYLTGIVSTSPSSVTISNNIFSNCWSGIKAQTGSALTVEGNTFTKCNDGLDVADGASITITNNLIDSNSRYGINGGGYIDSNTITNNQIGIHNPSTGSIINNNNIAGNTQYSVTASTASVNAENNWWGTTDTQTINQTIYDAKIDHALGTITFVPFLNSPNPMAPAIPPSTPTLTPIPTPIPIPTIEPTPTPTIQPTTTTPEPAPPSEKSIITQDSTLLNLNLITTAVVNLLILVWVIVILGYAVKGGISKYKARNKKQTEKSQTCSSLF